MMSAIAIKVISIILGSLVFSSCRAPLSQTDAASQVEKKSSEIGLLQALTIAEAATNGKKAYSLEREREAGQPVIEVGIDGQELFVHAMSGEIVVIENVDQMGDPEDRSEINTYRTLQPLAKISIAEALTAAETYAQGKAHTIELANEDGNLVYEAVVEFQEIYIDAGTGQILSLEEENADSKVSLPIKSSIQIPEGDN